MKTMLPRPFLTLLAAAGLLAPASAQVVINELDAQTPGSDVDEFVELYDGGGGNTSLNGLVLVLFNGSDDQSYGDPIDLTGFSTNNDGYFVVGSPGMPSADIEIPPGNSGWLQNGADGAAIFMDDAANYPNDTPATMANLVDAVVYGTNDNDDVLIAALGLTGLTLNEDLNGNQNTASVGRTTDGVDTDDLDADWTTYEAPTPGGPNNPEEEISASLSANSISENGGTTTLTISLDSAPEGDITLDVFVRSFDNSELIIPTATILQGQTTVAVTLTGLDDAWRDFDQTLTLDISDPINRFFPAELEITITDDETGSPEGTGLRVNEVYPAIGGDANGDGMVVFNGSDEFVELVNDSVAPLDISGFTLSDFATVRHTFPAGTVLDPGCAIVVFGKNAPEGRPAAFGGALVQNANGANEFGLSLNNAADLISVKNLAGVEVAGTNWVDAISDNGSLTLDPDLNATNTYTVHFAFGTPFSPGRTNTDQPFCVVASLDASVSPGLISEDAGPGAVTLTLTRLDTPLDASLTVDLSSSDTSEATVPANATFDIGEEEIDVLVDIVNDNAADALQTVVITASASGFIDGSAELLVDDDGDPAPTLFINEVDYDPEGTDAEGLEFVEIYDGGDGNTPLDGFVLVFYNGNNGDDAAYRAISLDGASTNGNGFYVASTPSNGIQNGGSGGDGLALYSGGNPGDFNGSLPGAPPAGALLVDALVYELGDGVLAAALGYEGPDLNDGGSADGISRLPDGTGEFALAPLTRGSSNGGGGGSAYDTWAAGFPGIGGRNDDDEGDGIPNILEFALGLDPGVFNSLPAPEINAGTGNLRWTLAKGAEAGADADTSYFAEVSTDGETWGANDVSIVTDDAGTFAAEYTGASPVALLRVGAQ